MNHEMKVQVEEMLAEMPELTIGTVREVIGYYGEKPPNFDVMRRTELEEFSTHIPTAASVDDFRNHIDAFLENMRQDYGWYDEVMVESMVGRDRLYLTGLRAETKDELKARIAERRRKVELFVIAQQEMLELQGKK